MKPTIQELQAMLAEQVIEKLSGQIPNWPEIRKRHFRPSSLKAIAIDEYSKLNKSEPLKTDDKPKTDAKAPETNPVKQPADTSDK
jgi:hypothetical protein